MIRASFWITLFSVVCLLEAGVSRSALGDEIQGSGELRRIGHILNRAAHGPTLEEVERVRRMGVEAWIEEQLAPESIDESSNRELESRLAGLREPAQGPVKGPAELKALAHIYAVHSRRQLQSVLGEFWENHFTTDLDKVAEWLDALQNSDASDAFTTESARREAARLELEEFEFFRSHALGNFSDLLVRSATGPTMLVYLDNILNVRGNANENYAREILELHTFGVDNGYKQVDIQELAKCFTGWGVAKVAPDRRFDPHAPSGVRVEEIALASPADAPDGGWRFLKGTSEPPASWNAPSFDDSAWPTGPAGIGYGDGDDVTVLDDMQGRYTTVYLRKRFQVADPSSLKGNLILSVLVDDGCVAYLNGVEAARFNAPGKAGDPIPSTAVASQTHEAGSAPIQFSLNAQRERLRAGENVLAIQVLNSAKESSDLTMIPRLVDRRTLEGSIENGDPRGVWTFHFFSELHNAKESKTLFKGSPQSLPVPGAAGPDGAKEAQAAIERILDHPSTATFVCAKLIQRFVGDEIDFRKPSDGPYAALLRRTIDAWNASHPKGDIKAVVRTILSSDEFWSETARRAKVKDPFELIASSLRALGGRSSGLGLPEHLQAMGMELFTRNEPDGWPEVGSELLDTGTFRSRLAFAQALALGNPASSPDLGWDARSTIEKHHLDDPARVIDFFDALLFQGSLSPRERAAVHEFLTTDDAYGALPRESTRPEFEERVRGAVGFLLSLPQWHLQ